MNPSTAGSQLGQPNTTAIVFFLLFVGITLAITYWAARRTKTTSEFFAAGGNISAVQNGFALAGDFMSAASFLGIAGLVATSGFDGLIYSVGWLVGWPVVTFLIAEPLRNLGKYTFADAVAYRLKQTPVRLSAAVGTLTVVIFYLIAQMVGAGNLIHLLFGLSYEMAVITVGAVMILYVLFGGMIATTWVQIVKAVLLLGGASALAVAVLWKFGMNPAALFSEAARMYGPEVLAPGKLVANPLETISLGVALMFGTAGLPHILMRFYTVPDAKAARTSVFYATGLIGFFYLVTFVLGFGAAVLVGRQGITAVDKGGNMAAPMLAEVVGGTGFLGFISAVSFATILAVVAGLTLSGAAALSHDLWSHVVRKGHAPESEQLKVARLASLLLGVLAVILGVVFKGQNVAFMVGLAFAIAASANFPALLLSMLWRGFTTRGAVASMLTGAFSAVLLIFLSPTVQVELLGNASAPFPLKNPGLVTIPLSFLVGWVVSLLSPEDEASRRFAEVQHRMHVGALLPPPVVTPPGPAGSVPPGIPEAPRKV
ncbi:sodium/solute symporter [Corallococcus sp. BB11-1]|uniref:sodium:solute symporter family transporter n=1 Tax=Corallococcus sp. BB11-1 TaxID=2996783 RepID=UPI00226ED2A5|nr:sodium/solute symporter [Corallococcus sp. BB11-1]MCY1034967.1 sodium/solute symporter [Corallococcus sp. BB11-1]